MSPEASTHPLISEPSEELLTNEALTIETHADSLINELFADIDQLLDGNLPPQTVTPPKAKTTGSEIVLPHSIPAGRIKDVSTLVIQHPSTTAIQKYQPTRRILEMLLIVGAISSLAANTIYLVESGLLTKLMHPTPQPKLLTKKNTAAEFVDYMLSALNVIDNSETPTNQTPAKPSLTALSLPSIPTTGNLPPAPLTNDTLATASPRSDVVERIYVPVYQAPPPMRYDLPSVPQLPQPKPGDKMLATTLQPTHTTIKPANKLLALSPLPLPTLPSNTQSAAYPSAPSAELEGLLELGKNSVALFKMNGVTHRFNLGESIGDSGWTLVDVSHGGAVIRRNGEVRSIYPGENL
jgi:hypothetical protein